MVRDHVGRHEHAIGLVVVSIPASSTQEAIPPMQQQ